MALKHARKRRNKRLVVVGFRPLAEKVFLPLRIWVCPECGRFCVHGRKRGGEIFFRNFAHFNLLLKILNRLKEAAQGLPRVGRAGGGYAASLVRSS